MKKISILFKVFDKKYVIIPCGLITLFFLFIYKNQCSYYLNEYMLNSLRLQPFDGAGIFFLSFPFILFLTYIFSFAKFKDGINNKIIVIPIFLIIFLGWIYAWTSPFSESKNISNILKRNVNWYYNDFTVIEKSNRSNVGTMIPPLLREDLSKTQNYIFFSKDSIFLEHTIGLKEIEFKYQIADKYKLYNNKIQFALDSVKVFFKIKDSNDYFFISNVKNITDFSYINQFPSITKENKEKIKNEIKNNYLFKKNGKVSFYISDVNNRGGGFNFDCFIYDKNKELFYTKFCVEGYFN